MHSLLRITCARLLTDVDKATPSTDCHRYDHMVNRLLTGKISCNAASQADLTVLCVL